MDGITHAPSLCGKSVKIMELKLKDHKIDHLPTH